MNIRLRLPRRHRRRCILLTAFLSASLPLTLPVAHAGGLAGTIGWGPIRPPDAPTAPRDVPAGFPVIDTLRLADAIALARTTNPRLVAARFLTEAAEERIPQAGALPDPQLTLGLVNRPLYGFGNGERMTMNEIRVSQMFPWPGKLSLSRERAQYLATATALSASEAEASIIGLVKTQYFELASLDRTLAITGRTRDLLRDFFQVSQSLYAVGEGLQQDVLRAQVAVAQMTEEITIMTQRRVAMAARLNALMDREPRAPIGTLVLPAVGDSVAAVESLLATAAAHRPALRAAEEREHAAAAGHRAARREGYPDIMVALAYGQRQQFDDMGTLMIGLNLPLWAGSKTRPLGREMAAMQAMEGANVRELYNETVAELVEARAEVERARTLAVLYEMAILPQAKAAVESALSAYRVGRVDYMTLVENQMTVNRYEIEVVRIAAQYHQAVARIDALLGPAGGAR